MGPVDIRTGFKTTQKPVPDCWIWRVIRRTAFCVSLLIPLSVACAQTGYAQPGYAQPGYNQPGYGQSPGEERVASRAEVETPGGGRPFALPPGASGPYRVGSLGTKDVTVNVTPQNVPEQPTISPKPMEAARIIARVGDEVVLAGDLYGQVNQFLHSRLQQIPEEQRSQIPDEILQERRWQLIKQVLPQVIDGKLVYLDFLRSIPDKERIPEIQDSLFKAFDEQQLPVLIERSRVQTAADLDRLLRSFGSSLQQQRRTFAEQLAAAQWKQRSKDNSEVSHEDMIQFYRSSIATYRIEAKVKWEQLAAYDSETFSRAESRRRVAQMGNEVWRGAAFEAVAKRSSQGPTAALGGKYDWTTKGSLRSEILDEAIFALPPGHLSRILEDEDGCHILRVIERQDESYIPFAEAQTEIRKKIREERSEVALQEYVAKLREDFPVWTIFDEDPDFAGE